MMVLVMKMMLDIMHCEGRGDCNGDGDDCTLNGGSGGKALRWLGGEQSTCAGGRLARASETPAHGTVRFSSHLQWHVLRIHLRLRKH